MTSARSTASTEGVAGRTGARICERRLKRGLRQADLARACGISPSYLNLIEHDRRRIGGTLLIEMAQALGTDPSTLAHGAGAALRGGVARGRGGGPGARLRGRAGP